jgi:hypothetical protein
MTGPDVEAWARRQPDWTPTALTAVRADPGKRAVAIAGAIVVGLALAGVHWLGLVAAGALVGLVSRSPPRAVAWGVVVGLAALALTVGTHPIDAAAFLAFRPPVYVTVAAGLIAPVWGSLARLVV